MSTPSWPRNCRRYRRQFDYMKSRCPSLFVPFEVKRLLGASVIWLNERWFLENGLQVTGTSGREDAVKWLLSTFAWAVPHAHDRADAFAAESKLIDADRYGGAGIGTHGGSGRLGIIEGFHVKGLGPTPLVGAGMDKLHSSGFATLEEGIREAIFGEVAYAEAPSGAIPIIAILDTGTRTYWDERRALIVRPGFLRAAHLERALAFRPLFRPEIDYLNDVDRVGEVARMIRSDRSRRRVGLKVESMAETVERFAKQMAYALANRMHYGPWLTCNLAADGRLFDYGAATALPDWRGVRRRSGINQHDPASLKLCINELTYYLRKHGFNLDVLPDKVDAIFESAFERHFSDAMERLFGLCADNCSAPTRVRVAKALKRLFAAQLRHSLQSLSADVDATATPWLYEALAAPADFSDDNDSNEVSADPAPTDAMAVARQIRRLLQSEYDCGGDGCARLNASLAAARRLLRPRRELYRDQNLQKWIYRGLVERPHATAEEECARVREFVRHIVSISRRDFREIPAHWQVLGSVHDTHSLAVWCRHIRDGSNALFLLGATCGSSVWLFGECVRHARPAHVVNGPCMFQIEVASDYEGMSTWVECKGSRLLVPELDIRF